VTESIRSSLAELPSAMFEAILLFSTSMFFVGVVTSWTIRPTQASEF